MRLIRMRPNQGARSRRKIDASPGIDDPRSRSAIIRKS